MGTTQAGANEYGLVQSNTGPFKLNSFRVIERNTVAEQYKVVGYLNGQPVVGAEKLFVPVKGSFYTVDFSNDNAFQNIDEFRLYAETSVKLDFDDLLVSDPIVASTDAAAPLITMQPQGRTVAIGDVATLTVDATVSDGGTLSYQWYRNTVNSTTGGVPIIGATSPTYAAPTSSVGTTYYYVVITNINIEVNGNMAMTATSDAAAVTVNAGAPTFISAATAAFAENQSGTVYTAVATGTGTIAYSIAGGADQSKFGIDSSTGALTFIGAPNYEQPSDADGNNVYEVAVKATDAAGNSTKNVSVTVTDINDVSVSVADNGHISNNSITKQVTAGQTAGITFMTPEHDHSFLYIYDVLENEGTYPGGFYSYDGNDDKVRLLIQSEAGYTFDLSSFKFAADLDEAQQIQVTFTSGGENYSDTYPISQDGSEGYTILNAFDHSIDDVSQVELTVNGYAEFQDFEIADIRAALASGLTVSASDVTGAGTDGKTDISVTETAGAGNKFIYKDFAGSTVTVPFVGESVTGYDDLPSDGIIAASNGDKIAIAEVNANGKVVRFGQITAVVIAEPAPISAINSVTVTPETASVVQGGTEQLTATVDAVGGAATAVIWSSNDGSGKVTVNASGLVNAASDAAPGTYTITATSTFDGTKKDTATITVTAAPAVNSVSVTPETASVVQGGTEQLTAAVDAVGGAATAVIWTSNDGSGKVTVNASGLVNAASDAAPGTYTITATSTFDGTKKDTAAITVTAAPAVNSVTVTPETASVVQGGTKQLTATVEVVEGAARAVTWSSSDSGGKVTVNASGLVRVASDAAPGTYTITATSTFDGTKADTATITVTAAPAVNSVTVTPETASVVQGGTKQLTATVEVVEGAAGAVTWSSSDSGGKVTVNASGLVRVASDAAPGTYTITATSTFDGTKKDTAAITVTAAPAVNSVTVTPETASVVQGGTKQLTATVEVVEGAAGAVTWSSSDSGGKVTVNASGLVRVASDAAPGTYTITATSTFDGTKKDTAAITVTAAPAVNSVTVTPETASVVQGGTKQLTATVEVVEGAAGAVTWSSSDSGGKVTVNASGLVRVASDAAPGTYTITATSTFDGTK
ncbi:hypothetical protein D3P08_26960, partial [Paenibacillus nanensis]